MLEWLTRFESSLGHRGSFLSQLLVVSFSGSDFSMVRAKAYLSPSTKCSGSAAKYTPSDERASDDWSKWDNTRCTTCFL